MNLDVFPRHNLSGDAVKWARVAENVIRELAYSLNAKELAAISDNRAIAGQLGVVGRQIESLQLQQQEIQAQVDELAARGNARVTGSNLTVSSTSGSGWSSGTRNITIPGVAGGTRAAFVSVTANAGFSNSNQMNALGTTTVGGLVLGRNSIYQPNVNAPSGFNSGYNAAGVVNVPSGGVTLSLRLDAQSYQGTVSCTLSSITVNVLYADPQ